MEKYFADMWASELSMSSVWESAWEWLKPIFEKIAENYVVVVVGVVVPFLGLILRYFWDGIQKRVGYLISYQRKKEAMMKRKKELDDNRAHVESMKSKKEWNHFVIPAAVGDWLGRVEEIEKDLKTIPADVTWFNRYSLGKKVAECTSKIDDLIKEKEEIKWSNEQLAPAEVPFTKASTSASTSATSSVYSKFESRKKIFNLVKAAFQDNSVHRIGLWGLGGVGKTTMMKHLKIAAEQEHMFNFIVYVSFGNEWNPEDIQQKLAEQLGVKLEEVRKDAWADKLEKEFQALSSVGSKKILIMLDNLWDTIPLEDLGLGFLANGSAGLKILLTTRFEGVCGGMKVKEATTFVMESMEFEEAWRLFQQITNISDYAHLTDLHRIGQEIVMQCAGLPLAIETIAKSLNKKRKKEAVWSTVLCNLNQSRLKTLDVFKVLDLSFNFLESSNSKEIFRLCCYHPEDSDVPIENLVRYGVGFHLFGDIGSMKMKDIRNETQSCVEELKSVRFLLDSDNPGCVKMHDLVREFGRKYVYVHADTVMHNHSRSIQEWPEKDMDEHYTSISLECSGMHELPPQPKYPSLKFLELINSGLMWKRLSIPAGFFSQMEKLEILTLKNIDSFPPHPLPVFANLRSLCLHTLSSMEDLTFFENLPNLEILSLDGGSIEFLPESIGNLSRLRLMEVKSYGRRPRIHDSVFPKLQKLEELYVTDLGMELTNANRCDLKELFGKLTALEYNFETDTVPLKGATLQNLKRFKITVGCYFYERSIFEFRNIFSFVEEFRNTLILVTSKSEILACKLNALFGLVQKLGLEVENLTSLSEIWKAEDFLKLEDLRVDRCMDLDFLVNIDGGQQTNTFGEISQQLDCPCVFGSLKELCLTTCHGMKNVFRLYVASANLPALVKLEISYCEMLEEIIEIDKREDKTSTGVRKFEFPNLRELILRKLPKLVGFCRSIDVVEFPPILRSIEIWRCESLRHLFRPPITNSTLQLERLQIRVCTNFEAVACIRREIGGSNTEETVIDIEPELNDKTTTFFPAYLIRRYNSHLKELRLDELPSTVQAMFDMEVKVTRNNNEDNEGGRTGLKAVIQGLNDLEKLVLYNFKRMSHVWKWKKPGIDIQRKGLVYHVEGFHNLTEIFMSHCDGLKFLFTPLIAKALVNLQVLSIRRCWGMEEVVSDEQGKEETYVESIFFHHLAEVDLFELPKLKSIGGGTKKDWSTFNKKHYEAGQNMVAATVSSLCDSKKMKVQFCPELLHVVPSYAVLRLQRLEELLIRSCAKMEEVFETEGISRNGEGNDDIVMRRLNKMTLENLPMMKHIWWNRNTLVLQFPYLTRLSINGCDRLEHLIPYSTFCNLLHLQELEISGCRNLELIVEGGNGVDDSGNELEFRYLKSIKLENLPSLAVFSSIVCPIEWPCLDTLEISECPKLMSFTSGRLTTQKLEKITRGDYSYYELQDKDLNLSMMLVKEKKIEEKME